MDDELPFAGWFFIDNRDDRIPSCGIHLVSSVAVYFNLNEIGILGIAVRGSHFFNAVVATF